MNEDGSPRRPEDVDFERIAEGTVVAEDDAMPGGGSGVRAAAWSALCELDENGEYRRWGTDELADYIGIPARNIQGYMDSLRDGLVNSGRGRPSSGPIQPQMVLSLYNAKDQRYYWKRPVNKLEVGAYRIQRLNRLRGENETVLGQMSLGADEWDDRTLRRAKRWHELFGAELADVAEEHNEEMIRS